MAADDCRPTSADKTSPNATSANKMEILARLDQRDALIFALMTLEAQMGLVSEADPEAHEFIMGQMERREEETFRKNELMEKFAAERTARPSDCVRFRRP